MLRLLTAGESHGQALLAILEGLPAGLHISREDLDRDLRRRQGGYGRGERMRIEHDQARLLSGARFGKTLGGPLALLIENRDWPNWEERMNPFAPPPPALEEARVPRPGHGDLAGYYKFGFSDLREIAERASARETAARVAAGGVARKFLKEFEVEVFSHLLRVGSVQACPEGEQWEEIRARAEASILRCADPQAEEKMKAAIDRAQREGDTLGGVFQVVALGVPAGLGSYSQWDRRLDARLAAAIMSIPAVKGVEIGLGFAAAAQPGSQVHDEILLGREGRLIRPSNRAGGIEAGLSNGEPILLQAAMKPIPTLQRPLRSVNLHTRQQAPAGKERADVCAVPAAGVVAEAMCCLVLADVFMEKYGCDTLQEMKAAWEAHRRRIGPPRAT